LFSQIGILVGYFCFLVQEQPSLPVAMERQRNSGQVDRLVMQRSDPTTVYQLISIIKMQKLSGPYSALYTVSKARITISTESPISNQKDFVFSESLLPTLAPIIDPISTNKAGNHNILPRCQ
jgi:hypothetical protein